MNANLLFTTQKNNLLKSLQKKQIKKAVLKSFFKTAFPFIIYNYLSFFKI